MAETVNTMYQTDDDGTKLQDTQIGSNTLTEKGESVPKDVTIPINKRALLKDSETYMLETFDKNIMIIINQEHIDGYKPRTGTEKDVTRLMDTFGKFRFEVTPHNDKYRHEVGRIMYDFSNLDFTDYGCIAIAILTHGSEKGGLRARDNKYKEKKILELIKKNPTLATKPILYIIQACRGARLTEVNEVQVQKDNASSVQQYKLPQTADTLVLHSTYDGFYSNRDVEHGSWFIQTLCDKINELADKRDLESIMTVVKREVAINKEYYYENAATNECEFNKQMPVTESTLIRKLYFKRNSMGVLKPGTELSIISNTITYNIPVTNKSQPCEMCVAVALERFDYVLKSLEHFIKDNPNNPKAKSLMVITKPCLVSDVEAKIEMARVIRDFFLSNTCDTDKYKYLYIWKERIDS